MKTFSKEWRTIHREALKELFSEREMRIVKIGFVIDILLFTCVWLFWKDAGIVINILFFMLGLNSSLLFSMWKLGKRKGFI